MLKALRCQKTAKYYSYVEIQYLPGEPPPGMKYSASVALVSTETKIAKFPLPLLFVSYFYFLFIVKQIVRGTVI